MYIPENDSSIDLLWEQYEAVLDGITFTSIPVNQTVQPVPKSSESPSQGGGGTEKNNPNPPKVTPSNQPGTGGGLGSTYPAGGTFLIFFLPIALIGLTIGLILLISEMRRPGKLKKPAELLSA